MTKRSVLSVKALSQIVHLQPWVLVFANPLGLRGCLVSYFSFSASEWCSHAHMHTLHALIVTFIEACIQIDSIADSYPKPFDIICNNWMARHS